MTESDSSSSASSSDPSPRPDEGDVSPNAPVIDAPVIDASTVDVDRRHPVLGAILLCVFLPISVLSTTIVYQGVRWMDRGSSVHPDDFYESTRFALASGPRRQRLDIIEHLGAQGPASKGFLDDLRQIAAGDDPELAEAADIAIRQIDGSGF